MGKESNYEGSGNEVVHKRGKELLGSSYDHETFEGIVESYISEAPGLIYALSCLESDLAKANDDVARDSIREQWVEDHK